MNIAGNNPYVTLKKIQITDKDAAKTPFLLLNVKAIENMVLLKIKRYKVSTFLKIQYGYFITIYKSIDTYYQKFKISKIK